MNAMDDVLLLGEMIEIGKEMMDNGWEVKPTDNSMYVWKSPCDKEFLSHSSNVPIKGAIDLFQTE